MYDFQRACPGLTPRPTPKHPSLSRQSGQNIQVSGREKERIEPGIGLYTEIPFALAGPKMDADHIFSDLLCSAGLCLLRRLLGSRPGKWWAVATKKVTLLGSRPGKCISAVVGSVT